MQYGKTDMEFSQERMKGNFAIHATMVNSTCLSEKEKRHRNHDINRRYMLRLFGQEESLLGGLLLNIYQFGFE